jgi:hypothetical protein
MDEYTYYCEASEEINNNGDKYRNELICPNIWKELLSIQTEYYIIIDKLTDYIYNNNNNYKIVCIFSNCCVSYE